MQRALKHCIYKLCKVLQQKICRARQTFLGCSISKMQLLQPDEHLQDALPATCCICFAVNPVPHNCRQPAHSPQRRAHISVCACTGLMKACSGCYIKPKAGLCWCCCWHNRLLLQCSACSSCRDKAHTHIFHVYQQHSDHKEKHV